MPLTISTTVNLPFESPHVKDDSHVAGVAFDGNFETNFGPTFEHGSLDLISSRIDKWDLQAIQRLKNNLHQGAGSLSGVIDSDDDEPVERDRLQVLRKWTQANDHQRKLARLPSSGSIISSAPSSPRDREATVPMRSPPKNSHNGSSAYREDFLHVHARQPPQPFLHQDFLLQQAVVLSGRLPSAIPLDGVISDGTASGDDESIVSEDNDILPHFSRFEHTSQDIIDEGMQVTDGNILNPEAFSYSETDRTTERDQMPITRNLLQAKFGKYTSSVIDSSSDGEGGSNHPKGRSVTYRHVIHPRKRLASLPFRGFTANSIINPSTATQEGDPTSQETTSRNRGVSPHHEMLPSFANLVLDGLIGKDMISPGTTSTDGESRRSFETIISETSVSSGVVEED